MLKLEAKTQEQKVVLEYLEKNASEALKAKINNGDKTLQGCWKYIYQQAKKMTTSNSICVKDDVVFGWAVHYFEKDSIKEGNIQEAKQEEPAKKPEQKKKQEPAKKPEKKEEESEQLSMF